jgi:rhodanese-related sulfurtransferase
LVKDGATLLDVRTVAEFADGHIQGATNIPIAELEGRTAEIPANRPVVVYCKSGRRSERAAKLLKEQGYEVHDMGAMSSW